MSENPILEEWKKSSPTLKRIDEFQRQQLRDLLAKCTEPQVDVFRRMWKSIEEVPEDKIPWAIKQCENTIKKNNEGKA